MDPDQLEPQFLVPMRELEITPALADLPLDVGLNAGLDIRRHHIRHRVSGGGGLGDM